MGALAIVLVIAFLAGIPIAFAVGLASLTFLLKSNIPLVLIAQRMYTGVDFFRSEEHTSELQSLS